MTRTAISPRLAIRILPNELTFYQTNSCWLRFSKLLIVDRDEEQTAGRHGGAWPDAGIGLQTGQEIRRVEIALADFEQHANYVTDHMLEESGAGHGIDKYLFFAGAGR